AHESLLVNGPGATSAAFASQAGDAIVVFVSVYGGNAVGVTDSAHDSFVVRATVAQDTSHAYDALEIFTAYDVSAGSAKTVSLTLSGPSVDSAAADIVDVTGVALSPLDHLGTPANYTTAANPEDSSALVSATSSDLVLAGISAVHAHNWRSAGGGTLLNDAH